MFTVPERKGSRTSNSGGTNNLKDRKDSSQIMVFEINNLKFATVVFFPEELVPAPVALRQFLQTTKEETLFNLQVYTDI